MDLHSEIVNGLIQYYKDNGLVHYVISSGKELRIRCPYCGDSTKNSRDAHLYIKIDNARSLLFYCQKCTTSGVVNAEFLRDNGINDEYLTRLVNEFNRINKRNSNRKLSESNIFSNIIHNPIKNLTIPYAINPNNKYNQHKLEYLNGRYDVDFDYSTWVDEYKVVFNLKQFFVTNELELTNLDIESFTRLTQDFIGFLSFDKRYLIMRNTNMIDDEDIRYFMFNIFDDDNAKRFYLPKQSIDLMQPEYNIVLAEGTFDIIGIKYHLYKNYTGNNTIFMAVNGKGYNRAIFDLVRMGFLNFNLTIYSDADVNPRFYKNLKKNNYLLSNTSIKVFYNEYSKDFGVPEKDIKLKMIYI